jgi:PadR family transcriptional regulator PadR
MVLDIQYYINYSTAVMPSDLEDKILKDLSNGTAWLVVLAIVASSDEPVHGYEIGRRLADEAPEGLSFKQGTLYPMLRTMEAEGLVRSTLVPSTEGPARKCFTITAEGRRVLVTWADAWKRTGRWMNRIVGGIDGNR